MDDPLLVNETLNTPVNGGWFYRFYSEGIFRNFEKPKPTAMSESNESAPAHQN